MTKARAGGCEPRQWFVWAMALVTVLAVSGCAPPTPPPPPPPPAPPQPLLRVFEDQFDGSGTFATYSALNGATLSRANGRLSVAMPSPLPTDGAGFRLELPGPVGDVGVRCLRFADFVIPESPNGTFMNWKWFGFDDSGAAAVILNTNIEQTGSFTIRYRKTDGTLIVERFSGRNWNEVKTKRWDRRRGGKQVMLEIEFKDGTRYNSPWLDPPGGFIAAFELLATVGDFSIGHVEGSELHWEPPASGLLADFSTPELQARSRDVIEWAVDSDAVLFGTVVAVDEGSREGREGLAQVTYRIDGVVKGLFPEGGEVMVFEEHAEEGAETILFLQWTKLEDGPDRFEALAAIPFTPMDLEAVFDRI